MASFPGKCLFDLRTCLYILSGRCTWVHWALTAYEIEDARRQWGMMVVVQGASLQTHSRTQTFEEPELLLTGWPGKSYRLSVSPSPYMLIWDSHLYGVGPNQMACLKVLCKLECAIMFIEFDSYKISCEQHGVYHPLWGFTWRLSCGGMCQSHTTTKMIVLGHLGRNLGTICRFLQKIAFKWQK